VETEKAIKQWTVNELISWTARYFEKKGFRKARLTAELLLSGSMNLSRTRLYTLWNEIVEEPSLETYRTFVRRYADGEPVEYILGYRWFMTYRFEVNPSVLIPRPETEELVEWVVTLEKGKKYRYLDLCSGSGVIGISLACLIPDAVVLASDISEKALEVAQKNALSLNVHQRVSFLVSDFLDALSEHLPSIEVVVCNPPYIAETERPVLQESVIRYEPELALFGGIDGLDFFKRTLSHIDQLKGKTLYFEFDPKQMEALKELYTPYGNVEFRQDIYHRWRFMKVSLAT
jgi:release factor glutamine methyltransferase